MAFTDFCGENTSTTAVIKLPMWCHRMWSWKAMCRITSGWQVCIQQAVVLRWISTGCWDKFNRERFSRVLTIKVFWGSAPLDLLWTECLPPHLTSHSQVEIITPHMMALGNGVFKRWWDHKGGALMDGISALTKEIPEGSLTFLPPLFPSPHVSHTVFCEPADPHQTTELPTPWFWNSQNCAK